MPYHVRITPKDPRLRSHDTLALDKDAGWIEHHIAAPRREGRDIFIDGRVFSWADIDQIHITETDQPSDQLLPQIRARRQKRPGVTWIPDDWYVAKDGLDVTEQFISGPPGTGPRPAPDTATTFADDRKAVMVIYGHDTPANQALFAWLRAIGLRPREWSQLIQASGSASPFIGEVLNKALHDVQAVIAFFTPDEYVTSSEADQSKGRFQARPNVLIEAGMALIAHPTRTIIAVLGDQELPSDLAGRHYVRLTHTSVQPLHDLAGRLRDAGCDIDLTGSDWLIPSHFPQRRLPADGNPPATQPPPEAHIPSSAPDADTPPADKAPDAAHTAPRAEPASEPLDANHETIGHQARQRERQETEARQVLVTIEAKQGQGYSHVITVSTPITYPIKQVEAQIAYQTNGGIGMTGTGFICDPARVDGQRRHYTFRASANPQIQPEPAIRFVDIHGNRFYQFHDHTQRFPSPFDWAQAIAAIDEWLRAGPTT
jgi:predicted nucleotide-binding protein